MPKRDETTGETTGETTDETAINDTTGATTVAEQEKPEPGPNPERPAPLNNEAQDETAQGVHRGEHGRPEEPLRADSLLAVGVMPNPGAGMKGAPFATQGDVNTATDDKDHKPSWPTVIIGDIVHYVEGEYEMSPLGGGQGRPTNGAEVHPAIVTRIWPDGTLNLHVFFDAVGSAIRAGVVHESAPADVLARASAAGAGMWKT